MRTYSSGMYMRLAFSVAIHVNADVLLIDEILAVATPRVSTQVLCAPEQIKSSGTAIALVSHSLGQIERICDTSLWLLDGENTRYGKPAGVHARYLEYLMGIQEGGGNGSAPAGYRRIHPRAYTGRWCGQKRRFSREEPVANLRFALPIQRAAPGVEVSCSKARDCWWQPKGRWLPEGQDAVTAVLHLESLPLVQGEYTVQAALFAQKDHVPVDVRESAGIFCVSAPENEPAARTSLPAGSGFDAAPARTAGAGLFAFFE